MQRLLPLFLLLVTVQFVPPCDPPPTKTVNQGTREHVDLKCKWGERDGIPCQS